MSFRRATNSFMVRLTTDGVVRMAKEQTYFMRRAAQERSAADRAADTAARTAHLELERRYRELVGISDADRSIAAGE
jgi:hypothetical protein